MARKKRTWQKDEFYHIVCRGNRRDPLFMDKWDFITFLFILQQVYEKIPFELVSYCFMTNHYHLQLRSKKEPIWKVMSLINKRYADYYNTKYRLTGHVFEKRYFSKMIFSQKGMIEVSCYIHLNPIEARMVENPEDYPWSSYSYYKKMPICPYDFFTREIILNQYTGSIFERSAKYCAEVMARIEHGFEVESIGWNELAGACTVSI
ncbi:transposase [Bacillus benzoevorans]|uniref:REP element-mobilizing transposase RayT n=1 Tax=Bacillus benzoevorans TaxID=1456 RepID=A0A7X0HTU4_9BACI|nr:transposase [Bacillus benzoevorans]MBB6446718.1 REP element-mobilizing transposase RayT [Bacillus benzoevorans]